jgi:hypothetical protein
MAPAEGLILKTHAKVAKEILKNLHGVTQRRNRGHRVK